jgi:hypothetical protein
MKMKPRSLGHSILALAASALAGGPASSDQEPPQRTVMKLSRSYTPPLRLFSTFRPNPLSQSPPYNQRKARRARRARHAAGGRKAFV